MSTLARRQGFHVVKLLTSVILAALGTADAFGQDKAEKPIRGGHLYVAASKSMETPHPFIGVRSISEFIKMTMFQSLTMYDEKGELHGVLASEWKSKQGNAVWEFKLRQRVKFHNGKELTSEDVVWSANYIMDSNNGASGYGVLSRAVKEVKATGKYTVEFTLKAPDALFPEAIEGLSVISIVPANSLAPKTLNVGSQPPPGTGPFKFESWTPGQTTTVARFDDYWGGSPYLDQVTFKLIAQEAGRFNALRAGDVQIAERLTPLQAQQVKKGSVSGIQVRSAGLTGGRILVYNSTSPLFKNPLVRQAFNLSLDRAAIMDQATLGVGTPRVVNVPPGSIFDKGLPQRTERDLNRARELLKKAGYTGAAINLLGRRGHEDWLEPIQRMASEAGFNIKLVIVESNVYTQREQEGAFDVVFENTGTSFEPGISYAAEFGCIPEGGARGGNISLYCNKEFDRLAREYAKESDVKKRADYFRQMAKILLDDAAHYTFGYSNDRWFAWSNKVMGFRNDGQGYFDPGGEGGLNKTWLKR